MKNNANANNLTCFEDFIGLDGYKEILMMLIGSSNKNNKAMDHIILYGPGGLGKTSLANIIAAESKRKMHYVIGPSITKATDLLTLLANINKNDILFVDEIHRIPKTIEEMLYSVMDNYSLNLVISKNSIGDNIDFNVEPFTLIGATTRFASLSSPLRSRFSLALKLDYYSVNNMIKIAKNICNKMNIKLDDECYEIICSRSRGIPRILVNNLKKINDFANYKNIELIDKNNMLKWLQILNINDYGLTSLDIEYLSVLIMTFSNEPTGIDTLAKALGEDRINVEDLCETHLIKSGLIYKTQKGRIATNKGIEIYKKIMLNR